MYNDLTFYELCRLYKHLGNCSVRITHDDSCSEFRWNSTTDDSDYRFVYVENVDGHPVTCYLLISKGWNVEVLQGDENV